MLVLPFVVAFVFADGVFGMSNNSCHAVILSWHFSLPFFFVLCFSPKAEDMFKSEYPLLRTFFKVRNNPL
mgnify:FL=1|jgi:hypothetical protein